MTLDKNTRTIYNQFWFLSVHTPSGTNNSSKKFLFCKPHNKFQLYKKMSGSKSGGEKRKLENGEAGSTSEGSDAKKAKDEDFLTRIAESRSDVCKSVAEFKFNKKRVRVLSKAQDFPDDSHGVVYWMSRDQRLQGKFYRSLIPYFFYTTQVFPLKTNPKNLDLSEDKSRSLRLFCKPLSYRQINMVFQ